MTNRYFQQRPPPVIVPAEHRDEIEKLTKASLVDLVWWLCAARGPLDGTTLDHFRYHRDRVEAIRDSESKYVRRTGSQTP